MKKYLIILLMLPLAGFSQEITLDSCIAAARQNWPAFRKQLTIDKKKQLIDETLNKNYLPKLILGGKATYQSEAITFPDIPNMPALFPEIPLDNYSVELGVNQIIYDGGAIKSTKEIQYAANKVETQQFNVETYGLTGKINNLYTTYLYLTKNKAILKVSEQELSHNLETLNSAYQNGVILKSDFQNIEAEKLKLQKELIKVNISKLSVLNSLNILTGLNIDTTVRFINPVITKNSDAIRPEISLLGAQKAYTETTILKYKTNRLPKFSAFGKAGYGRPGYDMLNTDMHGYYMVGARFSWEIFDWNLFKKQKQQVVLQQQIIEDNRATLEKQISMEENQYLDEIAKYSGQIELDKKIVNLKKEIYKAAESQMKNGTITSTEYLKIFNEWKRAKLTSEIDKLKLITAKLNYNHSKGNNY